MHMVQCCPFFEQKSSDSFGIFIPQGIFCCVHVYGLNVTKQNFWCFMPIQQAVRTTLVRGYQSPCHGFRWRPLAGLLAFSEAWTSTGRWGVGVSLFEARMHWWVPKLGIQKNGTWKSFGSQPFFDMRMWKLGGFFRKTRSIFSPVEWFELFKDMTSLAMKSPNWQWSDLSKLDVPLT